jgi:hypothetical protein
MAITQGFLSRPYTALSASYNIRVNVATSTQTLAFPTLTVGRKYWIQGDSTADSSAGDGDLCKLLATCLDSHPSSAGPGDFTVSLVEDANKCLLLKIQNNSSKAFAIQWADGATTIDPTLFGNGVTSDSYIVGNYSVTNLFTPSTVLSLGAPCSMDSRNMPMSVGGGGVTLGGLVYANTATTSTRQRQIGWSYIRQQFVLSEYAYSTATYCGTFDNFFLNHLATGADIRVTDDYSVASSYDRYRCTTSSNPISRSDSSVMFNVGPLTLVTS